MQLPRTFTYLLSAAEGRKEVGTEGGGSSSRNTILVPKIDVENMFEET
jgi:hypothetical protein